MTFREKLQELARGRNRSQLARDAGLPPTVLSNYINRGSVPRADIALAIAKALGVPLEWLVDDTQDLPAPTPEKASPGKLSDEELMDEVAKRYRHQVLRFRSRAAALEKVDWKRFSAVLLDVPPIEPLPQQLQAVHDLMWLETTTMYFAEGVYDPKLHANQQHARMPGSELPVEELDLRRQLERISNVVRANPFAKVFAEYFHIVQDHSISPERAQQRWDQWQRDVKALLDSDKPPALNSPHSSSGRKRKA